MKFKSFLLIAVSSLILTGCGGNNTSSSSSQSSSSTSSSTSTPATDGMKAAYEEAAGLEASSTSKKIESENFYTFSGVVTAMIGNSFVVQEGEYGIYVYTSTYIDGVASGKTVKIKSKVMNFNGQIETGEIDSISVLGTGDLPNPVKITSAYDLSNLKQNVLVDVTVTMPATLKTWSASSSAIIDTTLSSETLTIKFDKYSYIPQNGVIYDSCANHEAKITSAVTSCYSTQGSTQANELLFATNSGIERINNPATSVSVTATPSTVEAGQTVNLFTTVIPYNTTDTVELSITEGDDKAFIEGRKLVTLEAGTVKIIAKAGNVTSPEVTVTITEEAFPIVSIEISKCPSTAFVGDTLNESDIEVTGYYEDSTSAILTNVQFDIELPHTFDEDDKDGFSFVASYKKLSVTKEISVYDANQVLDYTCEKFTGGNAQYRSEKSCDLGNAGKWMINANMTVDNSGWRFGGKSISETECYMYSETSFDFEVNKVALSLGQFKGNIILNELSVKVYTTAEGAKDGGENDIVASLSGWDFAANSIASFNKSDETSWKDCYYRFAFNVTVSSSSNEFIELLGFSFFNNIIPE